MKSVAQWAAVVVVVMSAAAFGGCGSSVTEEDDGVGGGGAGGSSTSSAPPTTASTGSCVDPSCGECPDAEPADGAACSSPGRTCSYLAADCESSYTCEGGTWLLEDECEVPPVECFRGDAGGYEGFPCTMIGELCSAAGGCPMLCGEDLIWHEECPTCPADVPVAGDECDTALVAPCPYTVDTTCGPKPATATCDDPSGLWIVEVEPC
jgi:hypothetical protein